MVGIYLSGTGNTKHCIEKLVKILDNSAKTLPLESKNVVDEIRKNDIIIIGYPTQFSNAPYMVRDFIISHAEIWYGKKVLCVATMGAFSGDGAGCTARLLKKQGAVILGGLHIHMPDSVCDSKLLKKTVEENQKIIYEADKKIEKISAGLAAIYSAGDLDTKGIITYDMLNAVEDDDKFKKLTAAFSENDKKVTKAARKLRGKNLKPEKPKKSRSYKTDTLNRM